jgi:MFS transporter, BCD family, chlorophyll transporter
MSSDNHSRGLSWFSIVRMGLVQTSLGAIIVLTTSTMNRVMVVELALPAMLPGALVAFHYTLQFLRPRWGYGSDGGGRRRTPWIIGGMAALAIGGIGSSLATALMASHLWAGIALGILAFAFIGIGVGAAGTSLLALLATHVEAGRRGAAATIVWMMMIAGFVVTTITAGHYLDPFTVWRLVGVTSAVSLIAFAVTLIAVWGIEHDGARVTDPNTATAAKPPFMQALAEVWADANARRFTIFVFVSMLAYSMQDLILEPFAGLVFGLTPGETTQLSGVQNAGVFSGMLLVALAGSAGLGIGSLRSWTVAGCLASAVALVGLVAAGVSGPPWPLRPTVFALGAANGAFAVAAIGSMMSLAGSGTASREGVRMGMWGAAQAVAFGMGGFAGAALSDVFRSMGADPVVAYTTVFAGEAVLFTGAALLALSAILDDTRRAGTPARSGRDNSQLHPEPAETVAFSRG